MKSAADLAKLALRRLALDKLEPTPENYARAYAQEAGQPSADPAQQAALGKLLQLAIGDPAERQRLQALLADGQWAGLQQQAERLLASEGPAAQGELLAQTLDALVRGLERGGKQWTLARKKDGLARVLGANRSDGARLARRLAQLVKSWDSDAEAGVEAGAEEPTPSQFFDESEAAQAAQPNPVASAAPATDPDQGHWPQLAAELQLTVQAALEPPAGDAAAERARELMQALDAAQAAAQLEEVSRLAEPARRLLSHRRHVMEQLGQLCQQLSGSLVELSEDESWAQGQAALMDEALSQGLSALAVRSVAERLSQTQARQRELRVQRREARDALKALVQTLLAELASLNEHTDRFDQSLGRYAEVVEQADSLESLTGLVREMVEESRTVQGLVRATQGRLQSEHARAAELSERVGELEAELQRLATEVQTDQLTRVANRRGLLQQFEQQRSVLAREGGELAIALLDIDNFKKLNDSLGHSAGDEALRGLAARTQATLRPGDLVARYGGEEFVLLLPATPLDEAKQVLNRLQRALSSSLFLHEGKDVFVTFSAGVTLHRGNESLEATLARADEALYEAKRTGKNRTCVAP